MSENIDSVLAKGKEEMEGSITHLQESLQKTRTGKASPAMLGGIMVSYYGAPTPLTQVANVGTADSRTLTIQPWEKNILADIERAIFEANLGLTPMNDGEMIRISIPPLTEERRKELVKRVKAEGENTKVSLRNARQKMMDTIKKEVKDGYPEDEGKRKESDVQDMINNFSKKVDDIITNKEKELMTV